MSRIKSLASDTLIYGSFTIVGRFLTFLLTPIYANYLTMEEVGDITNIFAIIAFINIVYSFGMESSFFRFYSKEQPDESKTVFSLSYWTILLVAVINSLIIFSFAETIAPSISKLPDAVLIVRLSALLPLLDCLLIVPMALLRMTRKAKKFALTRFLMIIVAVVLNILFVAGLNWGAIGVFYAQMISSIFGILLLLRELIKYLTVKLDFNLFRDMLKFGLPTLPATLSGMVLQIVNIPILKFVLDSSETTALYAINHRLGIPMMLFVSIFEYAWKPFYLSRFKDADAKLLFSRILTYFTFASVSIFLSISMFVEYIVMIPFGSGVLIPSNYWSGMGIIPIILAGYFFNGVYNNFAAGFHIEKKTNFLPLAIGVAAVLNIILNFMLIPGYGIFGSAMATLISYIVSAVILYLYSQRVYPIQYEWKRIFILVFLAVFFYFLSTLVSSDISLLAGFILKFILLTGFISSLFITKFFNKAELGSFFTIFRKKN